MQLKQAMSKHVVTAAGKDTIADAAKRMRDSGVGCLVVTNAKEVLGIITDRDVVVHCVGQGHTPRECTVSRHMTSSVITAEPGMDLIEATGLMAEHHVKRLPVVEKGALVGLVSFTDIALALDRPMHNLLVGMAAARKLT